MTQKYTPTMEEVTVTPDMAEEWYLLSGGNRPITKSHVLFLADEMRHRWKINGEAIIFDANGKLIEGHHRLLASAEGKVSFRTIVIRGVDPAAKATINTGRTRSAGDALAYSNNSQHNLSLVAVTISRILDFEAGRMGRAGENKHSNAVIVAKAAKLPGLEDSIKAAKRCSKILTPGRSAWLHYLLKDSHDELVTEFFERLGDGLHMTNTSPLHHLRTRLINAQTTRRHLTLPESCALLVKTWNAHYRNKPVKSMRWEAGREDFPKLEGI